jgi:uncharacterized protein
MWQFIVRFILRNKATNLIIVLLLTSCMAYFASKVSMSYEMAQMLPSTDSTLIKYTRFKEIFGQDGSVLFLGIRDPRINQLKIFNQWNDLTEDLKKIDGVKETLSISKMFEMVKDDSLKKFKIVQIFNHKPTSQQELDTLFAKVYNIPFFKGLLYNPLDTATLMFITIDKGKIESNQRFAFMNEIKSVVAKFEKESGLEVHYSGLPFIRTYTSLKVRSELLLFSIMTMIVAAILLFIFFKSWKAVVFPMIIVFISILWTLGYLYLAGYKITILTGILPPLIIIIVVENCIFLLNKYHLEYRNHQNRIKALARTIRRVGAAMFLTNLATSVGFAAFGITGNKLLIEFGFIASISIMTVFVLCLILVPIFFSYIAPPTKKQIRHLDSPATEKIISLIEKLISTKRTAIYWITSLFVVVGFIGILLLKTTGNVVDDMPKGEKLYKDLCFFEREFKGVLPFEIMVDTKKKKGALQMNTITKIDKLEKALKEYPELSKSISIADVVKIAKMSYYNGDPEMYSLPDSYERAFILSYLPDNMGSKKTILNSFIDTSMQYTRISVQMANIGTHKIDSIKKNLKTKIDSIFNPDKFNVIITGTSIVFLEGTNYLVHNLAESLLLAIIIISLIMTYLFRSFRMVAIAIIPNLIPQILTAAFMGYVGIPIKPSTIIIFSIALGISADNTILFLSRFRMELKSNKDNIKLSVYKALSETAHSMIYSSTILFFGFTVFILSSFGGTQSLGKLISFTLLMALLTNLILLPSMLLSLDKRMAYKMKNEPILDVLEENEEPELLSE